MPRELVAVAPRQPVLREYEDEQVPADSVRVQVEFGAPKRGTELTAYYGYNNANFPQGLGNMCVGKLLKLGTTLTVSRLENASRVMGTLRKRTRGTQNGFSNCLIR